MKTFILILSITFSSYSAIFAQNIYTDVFQGSKTIVLDGIFKDLNLKKGVAKMAVPVKLPKKAKGFYYRITILPKKKNQDVPQKLLASLQNMSEQSSSIGSTTQIETYKSGKESNIYLLQGKKNASSFENFGYYKYKEKLIGYKSFCGYMDNSKMEDDFYIGVENKYELKGVKVILEVVAVQ